jgi:pimeloyl-ACP methyl ester carboxylesterase
MKSVKISTTEMAYVDEGHGVPVVLLHGFPLDHTMWDAQITALAGHWRVIAPDLRGFG